MSDQYRQLAMEVVVTLSETAPAMIRKFSAKFLNVFGEWPWCKKNYTYPEHIFCEKMSIIWQYKQFAYNPVTIKRTQKHLFEIAFLP